MGDIFFSNFLNQFHITDLIYTPPRPSPENIKKPGYFFVFWEYWNIEKLLAWNGLKGQSMKFDFHSGCGHSSQKSLNQFSVFKKISSIVIWNLLRDCLQISLPILSECKWIINFYSPWNQQKTVGFLMI